MMRTNKSRLLVLLTLTAAYIFYTAYSSSSSWLGEQHITEMKRRIQVKEESIERDVHFRSQHQIKHSQTTANLKPFRHPKTRSFRKSFSWPLDRPDFIEIVNKIVNKESLDSEIEVINPFPYNIIISENDTCPKEEIDVMVLVKSRLGNFHHRQAIRETWGDSERAVRVFNTSIRIVFFVGSCETTFSSRDSCQQIINKESATHRDIIQVDFLDFYSNNTLKTISMFNWLVDNCAHAKFALFSDDDSYISVKNLLHYTQDPMNDPLNVLSKNFFPYDGRLYTGWVARRRLPDRNPKSSWYMSSSEYPFDMYPDFVAGLSYILSNTAFRQIQASIPYVKRISIDDTYFGIIAKKLDLKLIHNKRFINSDRSYNASDFKDIIAYHCSGNYQYMKRIWREQVKLGNV